MAFMRGKSDSKVLIAGAGPVGLASALVLHKKGIPFEIIERDDRAGTHSYALALHPATLQTLRDWGLDKRLKDSSVTVRHLLFCDREKPRYNLDLTRIPGAESGLLVVGQDHLEEALFAPLESSHHPVLWSHRLASLQQSDASVELHLERLGEGMSGYAMARLEWQVERELTRHAAFVIGADGHFSMVRRQLGIDFPKVAPTQSFAVFEFKTDFQLGDRAHVIFDESGTSILWPLPGGYCRWGFEIDESSAEQHSRDKDRLFMQVGSHGFHALQTEMLEQMIRERAPWFNGSIGPFRWRMIVRFEKRLAESFGQGRVWLAGDAGHLAPPIGMQSMNIGIREGQQLATIISEVLEGEANEEKLEAYKVDRQREWRSLLEIDTRLQPRQSANGFLAAHTAGLIGCLPTSLANLSRFAEFLEMDLETV